MTSAQLWIFIGIVFASWAVGWLSATDRTGYLAAVAIGLGFAALLALVVAAVVLAPLMVVDRAARRRNERTRLAADADDQHAALMRGDARTGIYGTGHRCGTGGRRRTP